MHQIIAVEDDPMMQKLLVSALRVEGMHCTICATGEAGLAQAAADQPDLMLLDVHLPDMDGHEVCRRLKAAPATRDIPVIMLTGEARELEKRVAGLDAGAEDYLFKPISTKVLAARIRSILQAPRRPQP